MLPVVFYRHVAIDNSHGCTVLEWQHHSK